MGQKANKITLRFLKKQFNIQEANPSSLIHILGFLKAFNAYLQLKNVVILNTIYKECSNIATFSFNFFFSTKKCVAYRRLKMCLKYDVALKIFNKNLILLFNKYFGFYKKNLYHFKFLVLNSHVAKPLVSYFHKFLKIYKKNLFSRRFTLFIDFIKITALLCENKLSAASYIKYISLIFKFLAKKGHSLFFKFLRTVFRKIISCSFVVNKKIKGISFKINGKLKGKSRASSFNLNVGTMPSQSITVDIDFALCHTYTRLGAFGLRILIYK